MLTTMTPELFRLVLTAAITGVFWVPDGRAYLGQQ